MSLFVYVQSLLLVILEALCCNLFFETFSIKRIKVNAIVSNILIVAFLTTAYFITALIFRNNFWLKVIIIIIAMCIMGKVFFKINLIKSLILSLLFQALLLSIDFLTVVIVSFSKLYTSQFQINDYLFVILGKAILLFTIIFINKKFIKTNNILKDKELGKIIFIPIYSIVTIIGIIITSDASSTRNFFSVMTAFGIVGLNIVVIYVVNSIVIRERKINQYNSDLIKYKAKLENEENLKQKAHEYKNSLACILSLLKQNEVDRAIKYIENKSKENLTDLGILKTNHPVVNSVMNIKYKEASEKNITIEYKIEDLGTIRISDDDIMIILCNLLDNAIEASEKCMNSDKTINVKITKDNNNIYISVSNKYEHNIIHNKEKIETDKVDKENHGFGIKNIVETVIKNYGTYEINEAVNADNEKVFNFTIVLPV